MTNDAKSPGTSGVLLPLKVEYSLRALERRAPGEAQVVRGYMEQQSTGVAPSAALRIFPSARAFVARAASSGTATLSAGRNAAQLCARGCGQGAMVLLVDLCPVAFFDECEEHAQLGGPGVATATAAQVAAF